MLALRKIVAARGHVANYWETRGVKIRVGHLYPDYLNIYADRGNIAVLAERARARGHELEVQAIGMRDPVPAGEIDLFYVGGGQDREQALVAHDLVAEGGRAARGSRRTTRRSSPSAAATSCSAASTATSRARSCRESGSCRCTRSPARRG